MAVALLFILVIGMMIVGVPIAISLGLSSICSYCGTRMLL